jgi:GTP-binding protein
MRKENFRNIAIIAHVDHGKTTLVDGMLRQSGTFRENQVTGDRIMDSMDLERERGITIMAKNTAVWYKDVKINIMDTPGHADFGGEVERSLNMADGALLLVDASEGPLPQTRFVVKKALAKKLSMVLVINKIDRHDARIEEVVNEVYDLFIDLDATEDQISFPIVYTNAKLAQAHHRVGDGSTDLRPLFETILASIPGPEADDTAVPQFLITNLDYDSYVGQIGIGRLVNGVLETEKRYMLCSDDKRTPNVQFTCLYTFAGLKRTSVEKVVAGDIIAVAGVENLNIGDTITSLENPRPLPGIHIDEPTVSMIFYVNSGPFAGLDGKYLTSRHLAERLERESLKNIALKIRPLPERADAFEVCGRGELQMAILIETMRREEYEFMVSKPRVITKTQGGKVLEPFEHLLLDIPEEFIGVMNDKMSSRKGSMTNMINKGSGRVTMEFSISTRGLIGFRSQFLTDTKGAGVMNTLFDGYKPWCGHIQSRAKGSMVADRAGRVTTYACLAMVDRGQLIVPVGIEVYGGMIVGERNRSGDLDINITKEKKLTNVRSSTSEATVVLRPPRLLSLDQAIEFITEDELIEATPKNIRLRKMELDARKRASTRKQEKEQDEKSDE